MTDIYKERFLSTFPKESRTDMKICDKDWHCKLPGVVKLKYSSLTESVDCRVSSTPRRCPVSYECLMVTGLMLGCHHVTLHTVLWIPDTSYWPHGQHVTGFTITIFWGWTDPHRNTIWEMIKSSVLISFIVAVFMMLIWCPATQPGKPRQTYRAPVTGAELFIIELRNCRSGLNMWNSAGDWLVINIMGGNYVSPLR